MFKYVKFEKVTDDVTTYEFRGGNEDVKVNYFDVAVVSIESENEIAINELIASQAPQINCQEITKEEFKELVKDSGQLKRIRKIVKEKIALKYSIEDELALIKKDTSDAEMLQYELHIKECIDLGNSLKQDIGYPPSNIVEESEMHRQLLIKRRQEELGKLLIELPNGKVFNGDEKSIIHISRAIDTAKLYEELQGTPLLTTQWRLYNNETVEVTLDELKEAFVIGNMQQSNKFLELSKEIK